MKKSKRLTILLFVFIVSVFCGQLDIIGVPKKKKDYEVELEKIKKRMVKTTKEICHLKLDIKVKNKKISKVKCATCKNKQNNLQKKNDKLKKMIDEKDKMEKKLGLLECDKQAEEAEYKVLSKQVSHKNVLIKAGRRSSCCKRACCTKKKP